MAKKGFMTVRGTVTDYNEHLTDWYQKHLKDASHVTLAQYLADNNPLRHQFKVIINGGVLDGQGVLLNDTKGLSSGDQVEFKVDTSRVGSPFCQPVAHDIRKL